MKTMFENSGAMDLILLAELARLRRRHLEEQLKRYFDGRADI